MRAALIDLLMPRPALRRPGWTPLGPAYLAAHLRRLGHEVLLIERSRLFRASGGDRDAVDRAMARLLAAFSPDMIGLSAITDAFADLRRAARVARRTCGRSLLVAGGPHPSAAARETLGRLPEIDLIVRGEGEAPLAELAAGAQGASVRGVARRDGARIVENPPPEHHPPLDDLAPPARDLLDMAFYLAPSPFPIRHYPLRTLTLLTSRGCPYRCHFCTEPLVSGRSVRFHSAGYVVAEIEEALGRHPEIDALYFADECFTARPARVEEICRGLLARKDARRLRWSAQARVDAVDPGLLKTMREAGCIQLEFGVESGSRRMLERMGKRTTPEQAAEAIARTRGAGIRSLAYILWGYPGETPGDRRRTLRLLRRADPDVIVAGPAVPYPGNGLFADLVREGRLSATWWDERPRATPRFGLPTARAAAREATLVWLRSVLPRSLLDQVHQLGLGGTLRVFPFRQVARTAASVIASER